jgi:CDP-diacylglycerol--glycerol-3-phosphate 3-phosphatidyltransferase
MTLPNLITLTRLVLSPIFFILFFTGAWDHRLELFSLLAAWIVFGIIELSDLLDGYLARKMNKTSALGKLFDPFADSVSRITYFFCFTWVGIMPVWAFLLIVYRDLGVSFIRQLATNRGIVMSARLSGKVKAWIYALAGIAGMIKVSVDRLAILKSYNNDSLQIAVAIIFYLCAFVAVFSLVDYLAPMLSKAGRPQDRRPADTRRSDRK